MIILAIALAITVCVVGYLFYRNRNNNAVIAANNAKELDAANKLAAYMQYCKDNNLVPYADITLAKKMLA